MVEPVKTPMQIRLSVFDTGNITDVNYLPEKFTAFTPKDFVNTKQCEACGKGFGIGVGKHHW